MSQPGVSAACLCARLTVSVVLAMLPFATTAVAQSRDTSGNPVSPALGLKRSSEERGPPSPPQLSPQFRSLDGSGNNAAIPTLGQARQPLRRMAPPAYTDGISTMAGEDRPGARAISNALHAQSASIPGRRGLSDLFWQWGQFLDHDIDLSDGVDPPQPAPIAVPAGDPYFDPDWSGTRQIALNRSRYWTAVRRDEPREQLNELSSWIDASQVYGSSLTRSNELRRLDGSGGLRSSAGNLLPLSLTAAPEPGAPYEFFAGDARVNEQVGLTAMHTLFMREHNYQAQRLRQLHPEWGEELLYQSARAIVAAEMQAITYREFLPLLLGPHALPPYSGYRPTPDAAIANEFSTAAFRLGHTLLSPILLRLDAQGGEITAGHLSLFDAFFAPQRLRDEGGIEPLLRGLAAQACQELDVYVIDEVRNFLFGLPGSGGFDLASLNIQRGRDHGLPGYNTMRVALGLPPVSQFADMTRDATVQQRLAAAYAGPDQVDLWSGALAEDARPGAIVGETLYRILRAQFLALRDGDRFWWEGNLSPELREEAAATRLIDVIRRNTSIRNEIDDDPWHAGGSPVQRVAQAR